MPPVLSDLRPDGIPKITDRDQARRDPQLAVLSVLAHGQGDVETASAIGAAAAWAILPFPEDKRVVYSLLVEANLSEAARKAIEMQAGLGNFFNEAQRQNYEKGEAKGEAKGQAKALLLILANRGLTPTVEQQRQILACSDLATLERWLKHSLTVSSVDQLFATLG